MPQKLKLTTFQFQIGTPPQPGQGLRIGATRLYKILEEHAPAA